MVFYENVTICAMSRSKPLKYLENNLESNVTHALEMNFTIFLRKKFIKLGEKNWQISVNKMLVKYINIEKKN